MEKSYKMQQNAYVAEGGNEKGEKGRVATPNSISIFDSYNIKMARLKTLRSSILFYKTT